MMNRMTMKRRMRMMMVVKMRRPRKELLTTKCVMQLQ